MKKVILTLTIITGVAFAAPTYFNHVSNKLDVAMASEDWHICKMSNRTQTDFCQEAKAFLVKNNQPH